MPKGSPAFQTTGSPAWMTSCQGPAPKRAARLGAHSDGYDLTFVFHIPCSGGHSSLRCGDIGSNSNTRRKPFDVRKCPHNRGECASARKLFAHLQFEASWMTAISGAKTKACRENATGRSASCPTTREASLSEPLLRRSIPGWPGSGIRPGRTARIRRELHRFHRPGPLRGRLRRRSGARGRSGQCLRPMHQTPSQRRSRGSGRQQQVR